MGDGRSISASAGFLLLALVGGVEAMAQSKPPATTAQLVADGRGLAERLCQGCHLMDDKPGATVPAGVPTFRSIANTPTQSADRLRQLMLNPHPPMPDTQLSYPEIDRLIAYIDSLREVTPPLVPRERGNKPVYPDPS